MKKYLSALLAAMLLAACFAVPSSAMIVQQPGYKNIAVGCSYTSTPAYTDRVYPNDYQLVDGTELTDGVYGSTSYGTEWVAYDHRMNAQPEIVVDLGEVKSDLARLNIEFRAGMSDGVNIPNGVEYFASNDGTSFTSLGVGKCVSDGSKYKTELITENKFSARYVKAVIKATATFNFASEFEICVEAMVDVEVPDPDTTGFNFPGTSYLVRTDNGYIYGIAANTAYGDFGSYFVKGLSDIVVYNAKGNKKTSGKIATGDVIVKEVMGNENDRATVIIDGDVNGDGVVSSSDYAVVKRTFLRTYDKLAGANLSAAMVSGGKTIGSVDYVLIKRHVLGTYDLRTKYYKKAPLSEDTMKFQKTSDVAYKLSFTYNGKPASLTFDKKKWGTWNIGTFTYDGNMIAGGGTDWEYVYRASKTGTGGSAFSGGNHGNEALVSFEIFDSASGKKLDLATGQSVDTKGIKIVEKTKLLCLPNPTSVREDISGYKEDDIYCNVTRTYYLTGNIISLDVDYNYIRDIYFQKSYTCMFPVMKTYGRNFTFYLNDGTTFSGKTTDGTVYPEYSNNYIKGYEAQKISFHGDSQPSWIFDVEFSTPLDSTDNFSNNDKVFIWDMNRGGDKLYVSKYDDIVYTLVEAGTNFGTSSSWTFHVDN